MSKRLLIPIGLAAAVSVLSGCVVVPTDPAYGYGNGYGYGYGYGPAVVAPAPVVVVPPPHRHYYSRPYRWYR
jgi:hypothetical protein